MRAWRSSITSSCLRQVARFLFLSSEAHLIILRSQFKVNSLGTVHSITAFLPLLRASTTKKIVVIGSGAADPKANQTLGIANMAAYGMTKAAALIATTKFAIKLQNEGFVVITIAPGMVDTSATAGADRALPAVRTSFLCADLGVVRRGAG